MLNHTFEPETMADSRLAFGILLKTVINLF